MKEARARAAGGNGAGATPERAPGARKLEGVPGVKKLIAVASGKGGVGKSTVAVNLALGLQARGLKVGILDADIFGPSQPRLLGLKGQPQILKGKTLKPMEGYGLKVMSMGFMVDEETPVIWRGPMVVGALNQMLRDVAWGQDGELDVLVIDMPPGTGDVQLTMAQQVPLSGAVIVSTPQDLALIDARKGLGMFRKVGVPVLGIVENMSYFLCPTCGARSEIFGHGGAQAEAERLGVPFLGSVPLHMEIRARSDSGQPITATEPDGAHAQIFKEIAGKAWAELEGAEGAAAHRPGEFGGLLLEAAAGQRGVVEHRGVVHEQIDGPHLGADPSKGGGYCVAVGDIAFEGEDVSVGRRHRLRISGAVDIERGNRRSLRGENGAEGPSDPHG